jgi:N-acetylmuramoyl-L-alanine amidase
MRLINKIYIHCTATTGDEAGDVSVETVRRWHTSEPRNWSDIGYHYLISRDGTVHVAREIERPGAHVKGDNATSVGVVYTGGIDATTGLEWDTRTPEQIKALKTLVNALREVFPTIVSVHGHNEVSAKACPCFNVSAEFVEFNRGARPNFCGCGKK